MITGSKTLQQCTLLNIAPVTCFVVYNIPGHISHRVKVHDEMPAAICVIHKSAWKVHDTLINLWNYTDTNALPIQAFIISRIYWPWNLILMRSRGWRTKVETTPPLTPAAKCSHRTWLSKLLGCTRGFPTANPPDGAIVISYSTTKSRWSYCHNWRFAE